MNDLPRQKLREIIERYGLAVIEDPRRFEALMRDFCGQHKREINVLVGALKERVAADLLAEAGTTAGQVLAARLSRRLNDDLGFSEQAARWAVESWAMALGVSIAAPQAAAPKATAPKAAAPTPEARSEGGGEVDPDDPFIGEHAAPSSMAPEELLRQAARVILADNKATDLEKADLRIIRQRLGIPVAEARRIFAEVKAEKAISENSASQNQQPGAPPRPALTVSGQSGQQYRTITEALKAAQPGMRISVYPGLYKESLVIDKPVEIAGAGGRHQAIVESLGAPCVLLRGDGIIIRGLTLRGRMNAGGNEYFAVDIASGQSIIEDCDIEADANALISVRGLKTYSHIRRCRVRDGSNYGIWVWDNAQAVIEECEVSGNRGVGVVISGDTMEDARQMAAYMLDPAGGLPSVRDVLGLLIGGPEPDVNAKAYARLLRSKIDGGKDHGVWVHNQGAAEMEGCQVLGNSLAGVWVDLNSEAVISSCVISRNGWEAVRVAGLSFANVEDCDLRDNVGGAWAAEPESQVRGSGNKE